MAGRPLRLFLLAGEASGDVLGARLMAALRKRCGTDVSFIGVGGERMRAAGLTSLFPAEELAHVGTFEILRHVPRLMQRMKKCVQAVRDLRPDALVTIDAPGFGLRVAKRLHGEGIPLIHYVAPSVWAWKPWRAKQMARYLTHVLALLPFEPPYFTRVGLPCTFVGHAIIEGGADQGDGAAFRARHHIAPNTPILVVLPGSRGSEITRLGPIFGQTVANLKQTHPDLCVVVPTFSAVEPLVRHMADGWNHPPLIVTGDDDKYGAFAAARAALAASGTVALELALAKLPAVIAYRINWLTGQLYRRLIDLSKIKYANLVNIMHNKMLVPEYIQEYCTAANLTKAVNDLLNDEKARASQTAGLEEVARWLGQGVVPPSERAAAVVLTILAQQKTSAPI